MYIIKMGTDKSLVVTIHSTIYQGESNADVLTFIIPMTYEGIDISECVVTLRYILPDGTGGSEELELYIEPYNNNYYQYHLGVKSSFTMYDGEIEVWLTLLGAENEMLLRSGATVVEIVATKDITDYFSSSEMNQLDKLALKVAELETEKADNLSYDDDTQQLQLTSNGELIGDAIDISQMSGDTPIIYFGESSEDAEIDTEGGA